MLSSKGEKTANAIPVFSPLLVTDNEVSHNQEHGSCLAILGDMKNLVPVKRMNVHGHLVTKWVRPEEANEASTELNESTAAMATITLPDSIQWNSLGGNKASELLGSIMEDIENPDKLWKNFDLLSAALYSKNTAHAFLAAHDVVPKLRETWLNMNDADFMFSQEIENSEWDEAYKEANFNLLTAFSHSSQNFPWNTLNRADAELMVETIKSKLEEPESLWNNFSMLTNLLTSDHSDLGVEVAQSGAGVKMRDTWLKANGKKIDDIDGYEKVPSYKTYKYYHSEYLRAVLGAKHVAAEPKDTNLDETPSNETEEAFQSNSDKVTSGSYSSPGDYERFSADTAGFFADRARKKRNAERGYIEPKEPLVDLAADLVLDVSDKVVDGFKTFTKAQSSSTEGLEGTTFEWSDLNPFKRRKK